MKKNGSGPRPCSLCNWPSSKRFLKLLAFLLQSESDLENVLSHPSDLIFLFLNVCGASLTQSNVGSIIKIFCLLPFPSPDPKLLTCTQLLLRQVTVSCFRASLSFLRYHTHSKPGQGEAGTLSVVYRLPPPARKLYGFPVIIFVPQVRRIFSSLFGLGFGFILLEFMGK